MDGGVPLIHGKRHCISYKDEFLLIMYPKKKIGELFSLDQLPKVGELPPIFDKLIGKQMLFKLERVQGDAQKFEETFKFCRVCGHVDIIHVFLQSEPLVVNHGLKAYDFVPLIQSSYDVSSNFLGRGTAMLGGPSNAMCAVVGNMLVNTNNLLTPSEGPSQRVCFPIPNQSIVQDQLLNFGTSATPIFSNSNAFAQGAATLMWPGISFLQQQLFQFQDQGRRGRNM
ncbi:hypothetical protein SESBI_16327 [Sesbania bispinosa]|nr:hypothetical protein SESBI_16327 [Sesbania bispinosa]